MPPSLPLPSHTASSTVLLLVFFFFVVVVGFPLVGDLTHLMLMQCCRLQKCALVDAAVSHVASCLAVLVRLSLPCMSFFSPTCLFLPFFSFTFYAFCSLFLPLVAFHFIHLLFLINCYLLGLNPTNDALERFFLLFFFFTQRVFRPNFDLLYLVQTLRHARQDRWIFFFLITEQ